MNNSNQAAARYAASIDRAIRNEKTMADAHTAGNCLPRCVPCRLDRDTARFYALHPELRR